MSVLAGNILVCADASYEERDGLFSASRLVTVITVQPLATHAYFQSLTFVTCEPGDTSQHVMSLRLMTLDGKQAGASEDAPFYSGYRIDTDGIGGFTMRTMWEVKMENLPYCGWYWVCAYVDGWLIARTPLMLRR